jgi:aspartyl-tRNA(Asn)/glutamyl-tRNA(Gln) amidotransferase subunit B
LTAARETADYFESVLAGGGVEAKTAANWINVELAGALNRHGMDIGSSSVIAAALGELLKRIGDNTISGKMAKEVFEAMWAGEGSADDIIEKRGLRQITDSGAIEAIIDKIVAENPLQAGQYRAGKDKVFGFFVGKVMQATGGKANPAQVNKLLKDRLK